jgi:hypothetical protein
MRVLLRDTDSKLYYASPGNWVKDKSEALNFERIDRAAQAYENESYPFAEILVEDDTANTPLSEAGNMPMAESPR